MSELEHFIEKIENFDDLPLTSKIDFIVYYLLFEKGLVYISASAVNKCFDELPVQKHSNVALYLSRNSNPKKENSKYVKKKKGYVLERSVKLEIEKKIGKTKKTKVQGSLFTLELVEDTRGYIENIAFQANACYECGFYDASLVMIRKLLETLIIELFEKFKIENEIQNSSENYFFLSELIPKFLMNKKWVVGRNTKNSLPKIKKLCDLSAHNRRFNAKKPDIDNIKDDLRIVVEELIHLNNF